MAPVFPAGILIHYDDPVSFSFFVRVLHPVREDSRLLRIPKAAFSCMQTELTSQTDILKVLRESFSVEKGKTVILSNMLLSKLHFDSRHSEIQAPVG